MSSAKWHPASGEFGWLGDWESGSPEERAAYAEAQKALGALTTYETKVGDRTSDLEGYYGEKEDLLGQTYDLQRRQLGLSEEGLDIKREGIGLQREQLGLQGERLEVQESQALNQFMDQAYNLRTSGEAQTATSGLAGSRISQRGQERQEATLSGMMETQQDIYGIQREGLGVQGRQLDLSMSGIDLEQRGLGLQGEGIDLSEAGSLADLLKSKGVELSGIEDLLYQIETERITYEGVGKP